MQTQAEVEQALADGVREKLARGWTLADVGGDEDEVTLTLTMGTQVERHVAHLDDEFNAVRIDAGGALPARTTPDEFFTAALISGGGIEIENDCGRYFARAYFLDAHAKGKRAASRLVATALRDSDDVESAYVADGQAEFALELPGGKSATLIVSLDDSDKVVAAELRRYEYSADIATHTKQAAMKRRIGDAVTSIVDGMSGPVLVGAKRFEVSAIEANDPDDHTCGC